jgi:hypothetical protein
MRNIFILLISVSILSCSTNKTSTRQEPSANSTGIILKVNNSPQETFSQLTNYFKNRGFVLEKVNRFQHYLQTDFKTMDSEMYTYSVEAVIPPTDSTIVVFRGQVIGPHVQNPARIVKEMGRFSSTLWNRFHQTVIEFPHESVYYSTD